MTKKLSKRNVKKQNKRLKVNSNMENKLISYFKSLIKLNVNENTTFTDVLNQLTKIDTKKLLKRITSYSNYIFRNNRKNFENVIQSFSGVDQKKLDKSMQSLTKEKQIMQPLLDKFVENVAMIKDFPQDAEARLKKGYLEGVGLRGTEVEKYIRERMGKRAKLIIRTESSKINSALTEVRAKSLGLNAYIWSTSDDIRVRPSHKLMDNVLVFYGSTLTLDNMVGNCGEFPNCRCVPIPVVELEDIKFPVKVASRVLTITSKKKIAKVVYGSIKSYNKERFLQEFKDLFI